jgi:opacity protein-like surface antigen
LGSSALGISAGHAADIFVPPPPVMVEEVKPDYTGWYIRGDVGYVFESGSDWNYYVYPDDQTRFFYDEVDHRDGFTVGGGVGYRFAEHFRTDVTADYYSFDIDGSGKCPPQVFGGGCDYDDSSDADVWTVMANAYVDLPYMGPVTPYFGAGIGFAHVSYGDLSNKISFDGGEPFFEGTHKGEDSWRFASSLMAGASIDITRNLALDAGYRYTRVFEGDAYGYDEFDRALGASGVQTEDSGFDIHAVRAGLRYSFF